VEGRGWYSDVRGKLWIASASKVVSPQGLKEVEDQYRNSKGITQFPSTYPISALLGFIEVTDMLSHEEYVSQVPQHLREENGSDYLFICKNAQKLAIPFTISGQHKIWKLDRKVVEAANQAIKAQNS